MGIGGGGGGGVDGGGGGRCVWPDTKLYYPAKRKRNKLVSYKDDNRSFKILNVYSKFYRLLYLIKLVAVIV